MVLNIIWHDSNLVAINKPPGLLVHRTPLAKESETFAVQLLRDQLGRRVYPVHRLDRKTGGVLLFALNQSIGKAMHLAFSKRLIEKTYLAIVRGFTEPEGLIDHPLRKENGMMQESKTLYKTLAKSEIDLPFGAHSTSRYSLLEITPLTGRMHQIRRHFAHIRHPIIADRPHGCNKQNKLFKEKFGLITMMLHAQKLAFKHPETAEHVELVATLHPEFLRVLKALQFRIEP